MSLQKTLTKIFFEFFAFVWLIGWNWCRSFLLFRLIFFFVIHIGNDLKLRLHPWKDILSSLSGLFKAKWIHPHLGISGLIRFSSVRKIIVPRWFMRSLGLRLCDLRFFGCVFCGKERFRVAYCMFYFFWMMKRSWFKSTTSFTGNMNLRIRKVKKFYYAFIRVRITGLEIDTRVNRICIFPFELKIHFIIFIKF